MLYKNRVGTSICCPMPRVLRSQKIAVDSPDTLSGREEGAHANTLVPREEKDELLAILSPELVEKIGRKLNNLRYVGMWNMVSALQKHGNAQKQRGVCREFAHAVPMVNSMLLHGSLHSVSTLDLGPYDARHDPLIFSCIHHGMTLARGSEKMRQIIRSVVQQFPAAITLQNSHGQSPLHCLLQYPGATCKDVKVLMPNGECFEDGVLTSLTAYSQTPLLVLLRCQRAWAVVPHLIDSNREVLTMCDNTGSMPLHFCFYNVKTAICMRLFAALAAEEGNRHNNKTLVAQDSEEETPLHVLLSQLELSAVKDMAVVLIPRLIDSDQTVLLLKNRKLVPGGGMDKYQTDTPLHVALKKYPHTVPFHTLCLLIDKNQEVLRKRSSFSAEGSGYRDTPLHLAIKADMSLDVIAKLIDDDRDVLLIANGCDDLPLHTVLRTCTLDGGSTRHTQHSIVRYLMDQSVSKDPGVFARRGQFGDSMLHAATRCNLSFRILLEIINRSPDLLFVANNARLSNDEAGDTPLHFAIKQQLPWEVVRHFIDTDLVLLRRPNCFGDLPLHVAVLDSAPYQVIQQLLLLDDGMLLTKNGLPGPGNSPSTVGSTPLHLAILQEHSMQILQFLSQDVAIFRIVDADGNTPLHCALMQGLPLEQIRMFTPSSGEDLRLLRNSVKNRPLHMALEYPQVPQFDIIKFLSYNDMSDQNDKGMTPLHLAVAQQAGLDILRLLCARPVFDAPQVDVRTVANNNGVTPLLTAIRLSLGIERISFLIDHDRCMLFEADQDGHTPFHLAVVCQASADVVALLFPGEGMQPDLRIETSNDGNIPLTSAMQHGASLAVVQLCIDPMYQHALFIKSTTPHTGTPLQQYIQHGARPWDMPVMSALIDRNQKLLRLADEHGRLPVYAALENRCHEQALQVVPILFPAFRAHQASQHTRQFTKTTKEDIEKVCCIDGTLFHLAIYHRYNAKVFALLAELLEPVRDAMLQRLDHYKKTPLMYALECGLSREIIALLIDPATFANVDRHGMTPLHVALYHNATQCVIELLLRQGASAWRLTPDKFMDLPLHMAVRKSSHDTKSLPKQKVVKKLIDPLQAAILWPNHCGDTPLHVALSNISVCNTPDFIDILSLLVDSNGDVLGMTNKAGKTPLEMLPSPLSLVHSDDAEMLDIIQDFFNKYPVTMQT